MGGVLVLRTPVLLIPSFAYVLPPNYLEWGHCCVMVGSIGVAQVYGRGKRQFRVRGPQKSKGFRVV